MLEELDEVVVITCGLVSTVVILLTLVDSPGKYMIGCWYYNLGSLATVCGLVSVETVVVVTVGF